MAQIFPGFAGRIAEATSAVFGDSPLTTAVNEACQRYAHDLNNIQAGRGIDALLIAIVGAKGQGKTWVARQFVKDQRIRSRLHSGDLMDDATTQLVWIGPVAPEGLVPASEVYHPCPAAEMVQIGQPYVLLDTPGLTDADHRAASLAEQALSLAPLKLLVIARDQLRSAANLTIARQIDGAICIPVVNSVEPEELHDGEAASQLTYDLRTMRQYLQAMAPRAKVLGDLLVPDFEITGDEQAASESFLSAIVARLNELGINDRQLSSARDLRLKAAGERLQADVAKLIGDQLPRLAAAVEQLHRETRYLPQRILDSLLGNESVLITGVRMRLRARLISDTSLLWFPYRTLMSTLNLTQGAWDRVMLAMAGSLPSLFGALASWARNSQQNRELKSEMREGIQRRTQQQVEEQLRPLCDQFHRELVKLQPRQQRELGGASSPGMRLNGIEELQSRSQRIFDAAIDCHATRDWLVQVLGLLGTLLFWSFMAGPVVLIYREYILASYDVLIGGQGRSVQDFPQPTPGLLLSSLVLSLLPLAIYCMFVLTLSLSHRKVQRVARQIISEHEQAIEELSDKQVVRLDFEDPLLRQAEYLLTVGRPE